MIFSRRQPKPVLDLRQVRRGARFQWRRSATLVCLSLLLVVAIAGSAAFWLRHRPDPVLTTHQGLIDAISKNIILPSGEDPVVATVTDRTKLSDQPFLSQAQNGDRLLIYTKAKKVYIYRPALHKLVDVGPVSISESDLKQ